MDRTLFLYDGELSKVYAIQNALMEKFMDLMPGLKSNWNKGFSLISKYNIQVGKEEMDNGGKLNPSDMTAPAFGLSSLAFHKTNWTCKFMRHIVQEFVSKI
ncbi:MAG: hypothetical protein IPM92_09670 [Saprospiraceae bacterium]|nr:hypothetical protein [Saprospiraceae bacterium]